MKRLASIVAFVALGAAASAPAAGAAATRAEYVAQVDPICASYNPAAKQVVKGFNRRQKAADRKRARAIRKGKPPKPNLGPTIWLLRRSNVLIASMAAEIATVAPAPGDETAVSLWLQGFDEYIALTASAARNLKKGKFGRGLAFVLAATEAYLEGEQNVLGFGFAECVEEQATQTAARALPG